MHRHHDGTHGHGYVTMTAVEVSETAACSLCNPLTFFRHWLIAEAIWGSMCVSITSLGISFEQYNSSYGCV